MITSIRNYDEQLFNIITANGELWIGITYYFQNNNLFYLDCNEKEMFS